MIATIHRTLALSITILLLGSAVTGCSIPPEQEPEAGSSPPAGPIPEAPADVPAYAPSLSAFIALVETPGLYWEVELPGAGFFTHHVAVDDTLREAFARALTESGAQYRPEIADDVNRDIADGYLFISLYESGDGIYPGGAQQGVFTAFLLEENDPDAPGATMLTISNAETYEQDVYIGGGDLYGTLLSLLEAAKTETRADLEGEHVRLFSSVRESGDPDTQGGRSYDETGDLLECGNILLLLRYETGDEPSYTRWALEAFDLTTGESLYRIEGPEDRRHGALLRIAPLDDIPDYDYCLFYETGVSYRSSENPSREEFLALPEGVRPVYAESHRRPDAYDAYGDGVVWTGEDGVYLTVTKQDGVLQARILANEGAADLLDDPEGAPGPLSFRSPRFLLGGTKVAAGVYSESSYDTVGIALYDIASGAVTSLLRVIPPALPNYPINDRYAATWGLIDDPRLLDGQTGEITALPFMRIARSFDYRTFLVEDYTSLDAWNAPVYICTPDDPDDRSRLLLRASTPYARCSLIGVTQNYGIFHIQDFEGEWFAAAKYR